MPARDDEEHKVQSSPLSLSSAHLAEAVSRSSDGGITLFLSKLGLSYIGAHEATELAVAGRKGRQDNDSIVERLALGNNRLTSLPTEFALLTHLRYLNLRHNAFVTFPDVLTTMHSLDTLDLSYNKLKRLPPYPGNLIRLKILSLSRNKITKLPLYLTQFHKLELLQVDRNPIDWPPQTVLESFSDNHDIKNGRDCVLRLQNWMDAESARDKEFEDSGYHERSDLRNDRSNWKFFMQDKLHREPHSRSISIDSDVSTSSVLNSTGFAKQKSSQNGSLNLNKPLPQALDILPNPFSSVPANNLDALPEAEAMHIRTTSHASTLRKPQSIIVGGKMSLPDLRTGQEANKYHLISERRIPTVTTPDGLVSHQDTSSLPPAYDEHDPSPNSRVVPIVSVERSAHFRQPSTTDAYLPQPLRILSVSARCILFALGQLYQTLVQYSQQDENMSTIFRKVLEPANVTIHHLIRSLDRFDDISQKSTPSPAVCRALVESCRDTVTIFRKVIGLLVLKLGLIVSEDVRYARWLVLELYAVAAELSYSWQSMVAHLETLRPFLSNSFLKPPNFGPISVTDSVVNGMNSSEQFAPSIRLRPTEITQAGRTRTARRHAGSFSTKDVQMGKELPSYDVVPSKASGLAADSHTPTLRTPKRHVTLPVIAMPNSLPSSSSPAFAAPPYPGSYSDSFSHYRRPSQSSITAGVSLPSPANSRPILQPYTEILNAIQRTVELAPVVWDQIEEALGDLVVSNQDIHESIEQARSVTKRLSNDVAIISEGYSYADERLFRENAHLFVKALFQLSNIVKTYILPRSAISSLKTNLIALTDATEEFSGLLPMASISSHPAYSDSPTFANSLYNGTSQTHEDNQLLPSLYRSKSEQPPVRAVKQQPLTAYHSSRAPSLSKTPVAKRVRVYREASSEKSDPG